MIMTLRGGAMLLLLDEEALVKIRINIFLTWNRWIVISVILSGFEYHLRIFIVAIFVIFHYITPAGIFNNGWLNPINLGINPNKLILNLLFHRTWDSSKFPESSLISAPLLILQRFTIQLNVQLIKNPHKTYLKGSNNK
jgi:hypothetical protein